MRGPGGGFHRRVRRVVPRARRAACLSAVAGDAVLAERARAEAILSASDEHLPLERLIAAGRPAGSSARSVLTVRLPVCQYSVVCDRR